MSFLTPLYLLGLAAVSLPLVFHLIRRAPRGRYLFSSLMFLTPSPPRLTRRSRIDQWLLLLLRVAALTLLAAAFARPFLRTVAQMGVWNLPARQIAILVDTSASMQRGGIWPQVAGQVEALLADLGPGDDVALYRFGHELETLVPFDDAAGLEPAGKIAQVRAAVTSMRPGWSASCLGDSLVALADQVDQLGNRAEKDVGAMRQIIVISDLQEGARIDALRTYRWPGDVALAFRPVAAAASTNAAVHPAPAAEEPDADALRVRVGNSRDSQRDQFSLRWEDDLGRPAAAEPFPVYVPAGETRVVRVPLPPAGADADRLVLAGDDQPFDNAFFHVPLRQEQIEVVYIGNDGDDDQSGLSYYLARAFPDTPHRRVRFVARAPDDELAAGDLDAAALVVLASTVSGRQSERFADYVERGGSMLVVLKDAALSKVLARLLGADVPLAEAEPGDYAMFGQIDFGHPLFVPFADPRYSDFTRIHFWRYRAATLPDNWGGRVLARFDGGHPLLVEKPLGTGRIWVLFAGWHPADSDLARSTRFVPFLGGMLEQSKRAELGGNHYLVGEPVDLTELADSGATGSVRTPGGATLKLAAGAGSFDQTDLPGIYTVVLGNVSRQFAVNLPADESRTATMSVDELRQYGSGSGQPVSRAEMARRLRQTRDVELELRQKLWRWLILAAASVLLAETWLAGRLARVADTSVEAQP
ncbi:MAG: BatA domain-containing protein [Thermoguttaceae bacterium]